MHWNAAGEASTWNQKGIDEFCSFVTEMYTNYIETLLLKGKKGIVSDMSLLWLWWVTHYKHEKNIFIPYKYFTATFTYSFKLSI